MSISLHSATLPVFNTMLTNLSHLLGKAIDDVKVRGYDPSALITYRLAPDMLPFKNQILIACDVLKNGYARVSGLEAPKYEDNEATLEELQARIAKTLAWLNTVPASAIDGTEDKAITFPFGKNNTRTMRGEDYLMQWTLPNMYFHIATAYNVLRHNGVAIGKRDYLMGANQA